MVQSWTELQLRQTQFAQPCISQLPQMETHIS